MIGNRMRPKRRTQPDHDLDVEVDVNVHTDRAPPIHDPNDHDERIAQSEGYSWERDDRE